MTDSLDSESLEARCHILIHWLIHSFIQLFIKSKNFEYQKYTSHRYSRQCKQSSKQDAMGLPYGFHIQVEMKDNKQINKS